MTVPLTNFPGLFIGGAWAPADTHGRDAVINPATEEAIGQAPVGGVAEAEAAIAAAREAFDAGVWADLPQASRTATMRRMYEAFLSRADHIKALMIAESGATRRLSEGMLFAGALEHIDRLLDRSLLPRTRTLDIDTAPNPFDPSSRFIGAGVVVREPVGVVTAITPYNAPFLVNIAKVFPALLAGNTMVLKPSPYTPFSALMFGEVAQEIGLPPGVLNVVTGGADVGAMLTSDPRIDMVTFTGSDQVGAAIMGQAAPTTKKLLLELGGKSALIVREDADIERAAMEAIFQLTFNCGQGCALSTRHLVHNAIRPAYVAAMKAVVGQITMGDPADPATMLGPLIRGAARDRVEAMVARGQADGAKLVFGGSRPTHLPKGFFYNMTVFDDVESNMQIAQDEVFGPVASVIGFDTDEEAIRIANDSRYGLLGGIHSRDPAKAFEMALKIRTGGLAINGGVRKQADAPFGGYKRSGLGREYGDRWLDEYSHEKSITFPIGL
ncbi:MAG: aldehyde dehydrogenase [Caulobacteraceae bacterium]|nr:aldehyde dehydrogenase [Caulobacteraceae bacterium]